MKNRSRISNKLAAILLATTLSACASYNSRFVPTAVHFNTVVEDTNNELLVLNIIRASERRPMYFTRISALRSNFTVGGGIGVNTAFPQEDVTRQTSEVGQATSSLTETLSRGVNSVSPTASASYSHTPGFDYQILDSQDFYRGILTPITTETAAHYMQQGWSRNLISMLTIESIEIRDKSGVKDPIKYDNDPDTYDSDPDVETNLKKFQSFLKCVNITPLERSANETVFAGVDQSKIMSLEDLDLFNEARWAIGSKTRTDGNTGKVILSRSQSDTLKIGEPADKPECFEIKKALKDKTFTPTTETVQVPLNNTPSPTGLLASSEDREVHVTMRSLSGVIYYLGECLRAGEEACTYQSSSNEKRYISKITEKSRHTGNLPIAFETSLYSKTYMVPEGDVEGEDRTFTSLTFVNQMLNLQKAASAAPSTSTVRLVN